MRRVSVFIGRMVLLVSIGAILYTSLAVAREVVAERDKRGLVSVPRIAFCDRRVVAVETVKHLLKTFPKGTVLNAEAFEGDEARLFLEVFEGMFPTLSTPRAQAVATFTGQGISVLFFLQHGCLKGEHSLNASVYESIKAVMESRRRIP